MNAFHSRSYTTKHFDCFFPTGGSKNMKNFRPYSFVIMLVVVVLSLLLVACGGGEPTATPEPGATDTPAPTNTPEPTET
jgi:hypothetical protein